MKIDKKSEVAGKITDLRKKLTQKLGRPITLADEIYMEKKRVQLTQSEDPAEQKEGSEMVTTVSLISEIEDLASLEKSGDSTCIIVFAPLTLPKICLLYTSRCV